ncbi:Hypothetical predicted protein, partial [Pelobates cultripes]
MSRSIKSWLKQLDSDVERGIKCQDLNDTIWNLRMATEYLEEALCSIPFNGELLFGKTLDDSIKKAAEGSKVFLPQERRAKKT